MQPLYMLLLVLSVINCYGQNNNWQWGLGQTAPTNYWTSGASTFIDNDGNIYMSGTFRAPSMTVGNWTVYNQDTSSSTEDVFILKVDQWKNVLWMKSFGGSDPDGGGNIIQTLSGEFIIGGLFKSSSITVGSSTLTNAGLFDIYFIRFDADGNILSGKSIGSSGNDLLYGLRIDADLDIICAGSFDGPSLQIETTSLQNNSYEAVFLAKFDSDFSLLRARKITEYYSNILGRCSNTDSHGNIYMAGTFDSAPITFDSMTISNNNGGRDIFLAKYDSIGNLCWVNWYGGSAYDYITTLTVDINDNVFFSGDFQSPSIQFGSIVLINNDGVSQYYDGYLAKVDSAGQIAWALSVNGPLNEDEQGGALCADVFGNIYFGCRFSGASMYFNQDSVNATFGAFNSMIYKLDENGNIVCRQTINTEAVGLRADLLGNLYVHGSYMTPSITFGPDVLYWSGGLKFYLAKYNCNIDAGSEESQTSLPYTMFPNPASNIITISAGNDNEFIVDIIDGTGKIVAHSVDRKLALIDVTGYASGIYLVRVANENGEIDCRKLIIE